jgi:uncharacterized protein HemY
MQELMSQASAGNLLQANFVRRFSPEEIREAIQTLVATEQLELANALADAGLSLYPNSEDVLAIAGLLCMINQDWPMAVELMDDLMAIQGTRTPAFTFVMMVRALRCNLDPARAVEVLNRGLELYPEQLELIAEKLSLAEFSNSTFVSAERQQ